MIISFFLGTAPGVAHVCFASWALDLLHCITWRSEYWDCPYVHVLLLTFRERGRHVWSPEPWVVNICLHYQNQQWREVDVDHLFLWSFLDNGSLLGQLIWPRRPSTWCQLARGTKVPNPRRTFYFVAGWERGGEEVACYIYPHRLRTLELARWWHYLKLASQEDHPTPYTFYLQQLYSNLRHEQKETQFCFCIYRNLVKFSVALVSSFGFVNHLPSFTFALGFEAKLSMCCHAMEMKRTEAHQHLLLLKQSWYHSSLC